MAGSVVYSRVVACFNYCATWQEIARNSAQRSHET